MTGLETFAAEGVEAAAEKGVEGMAAKGDAANLTKEIGGVNDAGKLPKEIGGEIRNAEGCRYGDLIKDAHPGKEVHHIPANCINKLEKLDGPAIVMDKSDHRRTASCGNSLEAREYRAKQKEFVESGRFDKAVQMDIDDIRSKFGNKYDKAINQMLDYINDLRMEGKIQ